MKNHRQNKIIELITTQNIETQEQLLKALQDCGFQSTQATVSRDIKELRIIKTLDDTGGYRYCVAHKTETEHFDDRFQIIFRECVTKVDCARNLIVIKTMPGLAAAAGANIDAQHIPEVVGCLSGDDTTLIVMRDDESAASFSAEIRRMLE